MNSKKTVPHKSASSKGPVAHDWMAPLDVRAPCGPDLEYDPEFVVLSAKAVARPEAQYGDFVGSPDPVSWIDIERDCRRLMMRSKDVRLAVLFTRCRTRVASAAGLAEGIGLLSGWLAAFPATIHPQLDVDTDRDASLNIRMNALQSLTDTEGLLADVREIALARSTAVRLQVRDVERAFAHPRPSDALAPDSVIRQLDDLRQQQPAQLADFDAALTGLAAIGEWSHEHLGAYVPDLSPLTRMLRHVAGEGERHACMPQAASRGERDADEPVAGTLGGPSPTHLDEAARTVAIRSDWRSGGLIADRDSALELIREARRWFEAYEPSSPIPVLLRRAERFVGKRYAETVHAIPGELLAQWSADES